MGTVGTVLHRAHEREAVPFIDAGIIRVDLDGKIWRCKVRQVGNGWAKWIDRTPTRAEHITRCGNSVRLCIGNYQQIECSSSRLVWHVFRGPVPEDARVYRRDGDHLNNDPLNLYLSAPPTGKRPRTRRSAQTSGRPRGRPRKNIVFDEIYAAQLRDACDHPHESRLLEALIQHGSQTAAALALGCNTQTMSDIMKKLMARLAEASEEGAATWQPY